MNRREFLKKAGLAPLAAAGGRDVAIILDPQDPIASAGPVKWAAGELEKALTAKGVRVHRDGAVRILIAGAASPDAQKVLRASNVSLPDAAEAFALAPGLACGREVRGAVYAALEMADRVRYGAPELRSAVVERPANVIRSIARC